jgi:hypothetical protein
MNDFSDIEAELKKLRPAAVRPELLAKIESAFAQPAHVTPGSGFLSRPRAVKKDWLSLGLGLGLAGAALFMILARIGNEPRPTSQTPVARGGTVERDSRSDLRFVPTGLTEVVYHTHDEGLQFPNGADAPFRRMRYETRETLRWQNPATGATLQVSYPNEEVVLIPVSGQ